MPYAYYDGNKLCRYKQITKFVGCFAEFHNIDLSLKTTTFQLKAYPYLMKEGSVNVPKNCNHFGMSMSM